MPNTPNNNNPAIGEVISLLMLYRGWSQSRLSEVSGVSQPAINRILKKTHPNDPGHTYPHVGTIKKLCDAFEITVGQLYGREPLTPLNIGGRPASMINIADVPLIETNDIDVGNSGHWEARGAARKWLGCPVMHSDGTFAFVVSSNEMGGLGPSYMSGDIVYIDPAVSPLVGDDVLAVAPGNQNVFRRLHFFDGSLFLGAINPRYLHKLLRMEDCLIIGTAIVTCRVRNQGIVLGDSLKLSANDSNDRS